MTEKEMRGTSAEKMKQVHKLLGELQVRPEARQRINKDGFIENQVVYIDLEKYPTDVLAEEESKDA